jgi:FAD/FMN-containing dehydrogenase
VNSVDQFVVKSSFLVRFGGIVGSKYLITEPAEQEPDLIELRGLYHGPAVLPPGSVGEDAAILKLANETRTPAVPQGSNIGLVGG